MNKTANISYCRKAPKVKSYSIKSKFNTHDSLTGLYSRDFIIQKAKQLDGECHSMGLIYCDLDLVKFINDVLGHNFGDELICKAGNLIASTFDTYPFIGRVGGDEFAILLPDSSKEELSQACKKLRNRISAMNRNRENFPLSFSIGSAIKRDDSKTLMDLYQEADANMYHEKLQRSSYIRETLLQRLLQVLVKRGMMGQEHGARSSQVSLRLGQRLALPKGRLDQLVLACQFHDIGKIRIPKRILNKPGSLNKEEEEIIKRHSEIAHRVVLSVPQLASIADLILKHHESWDGSGYPFGLKGEDIPLECRINLIADAYDAMTSNRPYRKAMSHQEALTELIRCSGSMFDPELVTLFCEEFRDGVK